MTDHEAAIRAACGALADALVAAVAEGRQSAPERLLSVDEAAAACGFGRTTLYGLMSAGRVRSVSAGRRRLIPISAIAQFVDAQREAAPVVATPGAAMEASGGSRRRPRSA